MSRYPRCIDTRPSPAQQFQFDREQLNALADSRRAAYEAASPYPHTVLDDFLPENVLDAVLAEFPRPQDAEWIEFDSATQRKLATKDDAAMGVHTRHLLAELNSSAFVDFLERLTGIEGLVGDPHFEGGGLHQIEPGGLLKVHADFSRHPRLGLERRLNVLIYLNRDWRDEYGGAFELWNRDMTACTERVMPYFNRCVVFTTSSTSYHGHPEPLASPPGQTRKSLALYYYTRNRPREELAAPHNTVFQARPGERFPPAERLKAAALKVTPPILVEARRRRSRRD